MKVVASPQQLSSGDFQKAKPGGMKVFAYPQPAQGLPSGSVGAASHAAGGRDTGAGIVLPALFSDHMVIQRNSRIPFWGTAVAGRKITVSLRDQQVSAIADSKGKWIVYLAPLQAGGPLEVMITGDRDTIRLKDVFVGEVWVASGQSIMEMTLGPTRFFNGVNNYAQELAASEDSLLRVFTVVKHSSPDTLQTQVSGEWVLSDPRNAGGFTAANTFSNILCGRYSACHDMYPCL